MTRILALLGTISLALLCACPLGEASDTPDNGIPADASVTQDASVTSDTTTGTDTPVAGTCTTNRDCYTRASSAPVCDTATGTCVQARTFLAMPCDTSDDCRTYYNTSKVTCSQAKLCSFPCFHPGEGPSTDCGYGSERNCGFGSVCECFDTTYCGNENAVCGTVSKLCMLKCESNLDCAPVAGTTCDLSSGQCVK